MEKNNAPPIWGLQPIYEQKLDFYTPQSKE